MFLNGKSKKLVIGGTVSPPGPGHPLWAASMLCG
jgi:hypothetical protein